MSMTGREAEYESLGDQQRAEDWPTEIEAGGRTWYYTGKDGNRISDGLACREYKNTGANDDIDERLWADEHGNITDDSEV